MWNQPFWKLSNMRKYHRNNLLIVIRIESQILELLLFQDIAFAVSRYSFCCFKIQLLLFLKNGNHYFEIASTDAKH